MLFAYRVPGFGYTYMYINKKDVGFCTPAYPSLQALALPPPQDKQRISPRRAVYIRPLPMASFEILHFVQNDKIKARVHRLGVINARSGRFRCRISRGGCQICEI